VELSGIEAISSFSTSSREGIFMEPIKVKIFSHCTKDIKPPSELQINNWLADHPDITIVQMLQSESMVAMDGSIERNLSITLLYREA
jgi:hypothetical protein